jgi:leucyl aminopeptidase (aminopeptidase T)
MRLQDGREIGEVARGMPNGKDGGHDSILLDETIRPSWNHMTGCGRPTNMKYFCSEAAAEPFPRVLFGC